MSGFSNVSALYTLGPEGTFSDKAARRLREHLGLPDLPIHFTRTIPETLDHAQDEADVLGVIPIENSDIGTVLPAQDALLRHAVTLEWEINVPVRFSLLVRGPLTAVREVFSHPAAHDQCTEFLHKELPEAKVQFTNSNTESGVKLEALPAGSTAAAIVPWDYPTPEGVSERRDNIQNIATNTTRFLAVRQASSAPAPDFDRHKTSLLIEPHRDYPGLLFSILEVFNRNALNLCRLESRPARVTPWTYVFFLDFNNSADTEKCLDELRKLPFDVRVLGTFDSVN